MQIKTPKKMGRPRKAVVLSNKERQQRWRDRVKREALEILQAISVAKIQQK